MKISICEIVLVFLKEKIVYIKSFYTNIAKHYKEKTTFFSDFYNKIWLLLNILTSNLEVNCDFANKKKRKIGPLTTWLGKDILKITWSINLRDQQDFKTCKFFFLLKSKYENLLVKAGINKNYVTWKIVVLFLHKWLLSIKMNY